MHRAVAAAGDHRAGIGTDGAAGGCGRVGRRRGLDEPAGHARLLQGPGHDAGVPGTAAAARPSGLAMSQTSPAT